MVSKWVFLFCALSLVAAELSADKKKSKQIEPIYALPMPEVLQPAPQPDRPLPAIGELRSLLRHTAAKGEGIDVSHYQGQINWEEVARDKNIQFVYVKATEGAKYVDPLYQQNIKGTRAKKLLVGT